MSWASVKRRRRRPESLGIYSRLSNSRNPCLTAYLGLEHGSADNGLNKSRYNRLLTFEFEMSWRIVLERASLLPPGKGIDCDIMSSWSVFDLIVVVHEVVEPLLLRRRLD